MNVLAVRVAMYVFASVVDLITTVILLGTGRGIEGNPLAARFAHDPVQLVLFKLIVTGLVVFTAYRLARLRRPLAETTMAAATALTIFVVVCGLATVQPVTASG
jgi:hypothetical protein